MWKEEGVISCAEVEKVFCIPEGEDVSRRFAIVERGPNQLLDAKQLLELLVLVVIHILIVVQELFLFG